MHAVSAKLLLKDVVIETGAGAPGAVGRSGEDAVNTAAVDAMNGKAGGNGTNTGMGSGCNVTTSPGGPAGINSCSSSPSNIDMNGGKGGIGRPRDKTCGTTLDDTAQPGSKGDNATSVVGTSGLGGDGGTGSTACGLTKPGNAGAIRNGAAGTKAEASLAFAGDFLYARPGGAGGTGQNGGGGGGAAAAGLRQVSERCSRRRRAAAAARAAAQREPAAAAAAAAVASSASWLSARRSS